MVSATLAHMSGLIAIVGRPNVGKSALFNRIAGRRIAIVHDQPGVTRDRVMTEAEWQGRAFTLVDTGGIGLLRGEKADDVITQAAFDQVQMAIESANVIILVVNVQEGVVPLDAEVARRLRAAGRPVLVAVNKADNARVEAGVTEFAALGFERMFPVSAIHERGIGTLMAAAMEFLPPPATSAEVVEEDMPYDDEGPVERKPAPEPPLGSPERPIRLAIVGRPNVGKSSIINSVTGSSRVIVSPIPGTTRDAVDVPFEVDTEGVRQHYTLIDTAGLRKARQVDNDIEAYSVERTRDAIGRCDIAVLVMDADGGVLEQDKKIGALITEARKACIIVVNKWDLVAEAVLEARKEEIARREAGRQIDPRNKQKTTLQEFAEWVQERLFFVSYAPVIFTSATDGFQLDRLLEAVRFVAAQLRQKIPTGMLNRTLADAIERRQPISNLGHRLKFFYATQVKQSPPTFVLFVNRGEPFDPAYEKYLAGELRKAFGYEGCPLVLVPRSRPKKVESIRKPFKPAAAQKARPWKGRRPVSELRGERPARPVVRPGPGKRVRKGLPAGSASRRRGGRA